MRKSDREIINRSVIDAIIRGCRVCRLGLSDDGQPYVVPLNFGYDGHALYFHGAPEGRKIDILRKNSRVCFEFDRVIDMVEAENACNWGTRYQSVIGFGNAEIITNPAAKTAALHVIMAQYSGRRYAFPEAVVNQTALIKVNITEMTGKSLERGSMKTDTAVDKFLSGYNCAQAVLHTCSGDFDFDPETALKIACGLGAGMGRKEEVCGAVTGGVLVIGLKYGRGGNDDRTATERTYKKTRELMDRFRQEHGTYICRELLDNCDLTTEEGQKFFKEKDFQNRTCKHCVRSVVQILEEII